jgi:hypothetical protein
VICNGQVDGSSASLTLSIPFGSPTSVLLSLSSDKADEARLKLEAERIFSLLGKEI